MGHLRTSNHPTVLRGLNVQSGLHKFGKEGVSTDPATDLVRGGGRIPLNYFASVDPCDQSRTEKVSLGSLEGFQNGDWVLEVVNPVLETLGLGKGTVLCCSSLS